MVCLNLQCLLTIDKLGNKNWRKPVTKNQKGERERERERESERETEINERERAFSTVEPNDIYKYYISFYEFKI